MNETRATAPSVLRTAALAFAVWTAFYGLQSVMSAALASQATATPLTMIEGGLLLAAVWSCLSLLIIAWHRYVRSIARSLMMLALLHLPTLLLVALVDTATSRFLWTHLEGVRLRITFAATAVYYADFDVVACVAIVAIAEAMLVRAALLERQRTSERLELLDRNLAIADEPTIGAVVGRDFVYVANASGRSTMPRAARSRATCSPAPFS